MTTVVNVHRPHPDTDELTLCGVSKTLAPTISREAAVGLVNDCERCKRLDTLITTVRVADEELADLIGEGMHTGLRKGTDAEDAYSLWKFINDSNTPAWSEAALFCAEALAEMGLRVIRVGESAPTETPAPLVSSSAPEPFPASAAPVTLISRPAEQVGTRMHELLEEYAAAEGARPVIPRAGAMWPPPPEVTVDQHRNQVLALLDDGEPYRQYLECAAGCGYVIGCGDAIENVTHASCAAQNTVRP